MLFRSDRKSTRLNSSHTIISYAVFCLKKKTNLALPLVLSRPPPVLTPSLSTTPPAVSSRVLSAAPPDSSGGGERFVVFFFFLMIRPPPKSPLFPSPPLFR